MDRIGLYRKGTDRIGVERSSERIGWERRRIEERSNGVAVHRRATAVLRNAQNSNGLVS